MASPFDGTAFHDLAFVDYGIISSRLNTDQKTDILRPCVMTRGTKMKSHLLICLGTRYVTKLGMQLSDIRRTIDFAFL